MVELACFKSIRGYSWMPFPAQIQLLAFVACVSGHIVCSLRGGQVNTHKITSHEEQPSKTYTNWLGMQAMIARNQTLLRPCICSFSPLEGSWLSAPPSVLLQTPQDGVEVSSLHYVM